MEARELLRNYVHYKDGHIDKDIIVDLTRLKVFERFPEKFRPIPLDEDWLLKFGFSYKKAAGISGADMWQGLGFWTLETQLNKFCLRGAKRDFFELVLDGHFNTRTRYVHQLQNLYFQLTSIELEIK